MKEKIYDELETAVINIMVKYQDFLGINSGDEYVNYDFTIKLLADQMTKTLFYQMGTNGITFICMDSLDKDIEIENKMRGISNSI